jgi:predicted RNA-binding protein with PIN domain
MALVRILVDGYSLLHNWPEVARAQPRYSAAARAGLIARLGLYQDASGIPVPLTPGARTSSPFVISVNSPEISLSSPRFWVS